MSPLNRVKDWPFPQDFEGIEDTKELAAHTQEYLRKLYENLNEESSDRIEDLGTIGITGLTQGSVLFAGASSVVAQDNDDFFFDATNIRFGINVGTSPSVTLDILGDVKLDGAVTINDAGASKDFRVEGLNDQNLIFGDASADKVGIGMNNPAHKLDVTGSIHSSNVIEAEGVIVSHGSHIEVDSGGSAEFIVDGYQNDADIQFQEDNVDKWIMGIDYSDSHFFKICQGGTMGTNTRLTIPTDSGSLMVYDSDSGYIQIDAEGVAQFVADSYQADAYLQFQENNVYKWYVGFDYTDSLAFTISEGVPGTNNRLKIAAGGAVTIGGTISSGTITVIDGSSLNLQEDITFTGATTENKVIFPDNLPVALDFTEAGNSYMYFLTTNGSERIVILKDLILGEKLLASNIEVANHGIIGQAGGALLTFDNTNNFLEITGCKVGIGTTTPGYPLTIADSETIASLEIIADFIDKNGTKGFVMGSNAIGALFGSRGGGQALTIGSGGGATDHIILESGSGNFGFNTSTFGTNASKVSAQATGTAPTTAPADAAQMWVADIAAGEAAFHFMTEHTDIIKLYQQAHIADAVTSHTVADTGETCDRSDIDAKLDALGTKINTIYTALENAGFLATS